MMARCRSQKAFTLVELVVGIVIMAIALTLVTSVFFGNPGRAVEPMMQARAAAFGQALMEEILAKAFDENTPAGGQPVCSAATTACTAEADFGPDGASESRSRYDDVDDFSDCGNRKPFTMISGDPAGGFDARFEVAICVTYDPAPNRKRIALTVYAPTGGGETAIDFVAYRGNF